MYNKHKYLKSNDKKILHKVKKQWIIISLGLLMAIGGGSLVTHADTTNSSVKPQVVTQDTTNPVTQQHSKNNITPSASSNGSQHNLSMAKPAELTSSSQNNQFTGDYTTGNLYGMNYKDYTNNKALEFTNGQATKLNWFYYVLPQENTQYIKFDDIDASHVTDMSNMFANDNSLKSIDLSGLHNTGNVTNMFGLFHNDNDLQSVKLPNNFNATNVSNMGCMFQNDGSLNNINLSGFHTSNKLRDISWMFSGSDITNIAFPNSFDTSGVTNMSGLFGWEPLVYLNLPQSFNTSNVTDMSNMFTNNSLSKLIIQSPNTKLANANLPLLYHENSNDTFSSQPNNFQSGTTGTFVDKSFFSLKSNPNKGIAEDDPWVLDNSYNQNFHFNSPQGRNNDIEPIIPHYANGKVDYWDVYYLWNPDPSNPEPFAYDNWGHAITKDFNTFKPVDTNDPTSLNNVAIPDPQYALDGYKRIEVVPSNTHSLPWYQVAGGSIISNHKKDGGQWLTHDSWGDPISPNARLAYFANYKPNNTGSYLAYSNPNNNGIYEQFRPYMESNIFDGNTVGIGMTDDFRDPYVTTNPTNPNQLVAYCAGGPSKRVYVLTSNDAINWHDNGYINLSNIPTYSIETPSVKVINNKPFLFFSVQNVKDNNQQTGRYTNRESFAYASGKYDNNGLFTLTPNSKFGSIDQGFDIYAGNCVNLDANHLLFLGWLDNWSYFGGISKHIGDFSLPRILSWNGNNIDSTPIDPGNLISSDKVNDTNNQYQSKGKVIVNFNQPETTFNINLARADNDNNNLNFKFLGNRIIISRSGSADTASNITQTVKFNTSHKLSSIQFYLDKNSVEAYIPEIHKMYSILDFANTKNAPYTLSCDVPNQITSYQFDMTQTPELENLNNINSEYSADKAELNRDLVALGTHTDSNITNSKNLLNSYFGDIKDEINNAQNNVDEVNAYNGDARQHAYIALANSHMDIANTKLYQAGLQLHNLNNVATPYIDASAADARIANYYKTSVANSVAKANQQAAEHAAQVADQNILNQQKASVANSVNAANQQKADQAAQQADQKIAQQQKDSVANSVAAANRAKANHAAQIADQNISDQQKQSVANSVNAANQRTATSAANSADQSIESSIANSYAKSADTSIVNSYKNSASASVSTANSSYAKTAAGKAAAKSGASSADKSIESSIASSYAKSADNSIANSYKNSVNTSVKAANQSKANSAAKSADTSLANSAAKSADNSIESSIANSYAKSANNSIANSVKNSIKNSVNAANQSKATSAAKSANTSIANSYRNSVNASVSSANQRTANSAKASADQSIENSEAKNTTPASQSTPDTPINPTPITFNSVVTPSSEASLSNSSVASSTAMPTSESTPESSASHQVTKPVTHHNNTHKIALVGVNKRAYFTSKHYEAKFTNKMRKHATVLEATVKSNHSVAYKLQIGKHVGYVYGYLTKLAKPSFMNKKNAYIHVGKRIIKVHARKFGYIRINKATQYNNHSYIKYNVTFGKKHGVMYGSLPVVKKTKKVANSKYYQFMPKHYHYAKVIKPLQMYSKKNFSKRTRRGAISKGITVRIKRVVKAGKFTRFELSNGKFITGLKNFTKLV